MNTIKCTLGLFISLFALGTITTAPIAVAEKSAGTHLYIAPSGNDAHVGTASEPFATLARARDVARALKSKDGLGKGGITIWLKDGEYAQTESFTLTEEDSGSPDSPITYRAVNPGKVRILGGHQLPAEKFTRLASDDPAPIQSDIKEKVYTIDLKSLGVNEYGQFPDAYRTAVAIPELFINDQRMTLAKWPNEGWAEIDKVIESGPAPWRKYASEALGTFQYSGDRPSAWAKAKDVWLEGYWCFDWASETIRIGVIDPSTKQITLSQKHVYGMGSGNPAPRRFRALNLLEELDAPGEYYLDRQEGKLYVYPPSSLENSRIVLSLLKEPVIQATGVSHLTFQGITVETTSGIGLQFKDTHHSAVIGCTVRNTGLDGIIIDGGSHCSVDSSDIYDTGTNGLLIGGGDRKTLQPSNHQAINNHIHHVSRRMRTHGYNIKLSGVGVKMAHNHIEEAPHQAIAVAGNDHLIEYNEINRVSTASDDCGALYMGRNPSERGTMIRYNYWHDIGSEFAHGSCAIYFDDGTGGQTVHGNVFYKASGGNFGAVFIHGGHDNSVTNNIFIECSRAIGAAPWAPSHWKEWLDGDLWKTRLYEEVDISSSIYTERYPALKDYENSHKLLRLNHAQDNLAVNCKSFANGNWDISNTVTLNHAPGFIDRKAKNFALREGAIVLNKLPELAEIPFDKMGLYTNEYRK